jgi:hypothetical protein
MTAKVDAIARPLSPHTLPLQRAHDLAKNSRAINGRQHGPLLAFDDFS